MKSKLLMFMLFTCCSQLVIAADEKWVNVATGKDGDKWDAKAGSLEFTKTKAEVPIAVVIGRITLKKTASINLYKWYVPINDCVKENGSVVSLNLAGEFQFENDFVFGAGNISSAIAENICEAAKEQVRTSSEKSL